VGSLIAAAAGLEVFAIALLRWGNLKVHVVEYIAAALGASLLYLLSVYAVWRLPGSRVLTIGIFATGVLFRITLLPLYPSLSDDLLRYRWEGKAQLSGVNTYRIPPEAPELRGLRDDTWPAVNGKQFTTMYGPLTELVYRETYRATGGRVVWMKLPALVFDLGTAVLLMLLLGRLGLPVSRVVVYWWCPLTIVEFAASGHNDSIAVFFLMAALLAEQCFRPPLALASLAASALAKVFAAFLAPVLIVREWRCLIDRAGRPLLWSLLVVVAICWPFRDGLPNLVPALAVGSGHWRNNDSLFGVVETLTSISTASWIYMAVVAGTSIVLAIRRVPLARAAYLLIGTILLGAANCFPWYLTWILPLQALFLNPAWLLFTATSSLSYQVLVRYQTSGIWHDSTLFRALEYVPVYAMLVAGWAKKK
jgi:hypothetical protein